MRAAGRDSGNPLDRLMRGRAQLVLDPLDGSNIEVAMHRAKRTIVLSGSLVQIGLAAALFPATLAAQSGHAGHGAPAATVPQPTTKKGDAITLGVDESMAHGHMKETPYMKLTPTRPATAEDSARASQVAAELRAAIEKYKDVRVAQADGYEMFAPKLPQQVYHFTSTWRSMKEAFRFNPAQPSSLLYRRTPSGTFELVGAMYHAPKRLSAEKLDERVPLSIARWHAHTNFCVPKRREQVRWLETRDGKPVFGPLGGITTREQCDAVQGKFHEQVFGWMVHAMVFESDDLGTVWGGDHGAHTNHRP